MTPSAKKKYIRPKTSDYDFSGICSEPFLEAGKKKRQRVKAGFFGDVTRHLAKAREAANGTMSYGRLLALVKVLADDVGRSCLHIIDYTEPRHQRCDADKPVEPQKQAEFMLIPDPAIEFQRIMLEQAAAQTRWLEELVAMSRIAITYSWPDCQEPLGPQINSLVEKRRAEPWVNPAGS